ncbi:hypothetical protein GIB67_031759 [Kingdonia uniflora]|uniref:DUF4283 domain-containing protein n=1 Tax=Kingdonia uniflora TaxID=39325 RepID=A0A7J7NKV8_9MAGN|nr:hypothetical protein GIB67_031759 [Kingdonia uniflora]
MDLWEIESAFPRASNNSNFIPNRAPFYAEMAKESEGRRCSLEQLPTPGRRVDFSSIKEPMDPTKGPWSPFFDPEKQKNSHALVWVKFPGLGVEFWEVEALMSLGRTLGTPIQIDHSSSTMDFGYFAKVPVDIDLAVPVPNKILVEVDEGDFWQRVELGSTPKFCSHCKIIGHTFVECRAIKEKVLRAEEQKEKQKSQEVPAPKANFTKNQKKRLRKKKQREALSKGKKLLDEPEAVSEIAAEVFHEMPQPTFDAGPSVQAGSSEIQRQMPQINALTYNAHRNPDDG